MAKKIKKSAKKGKDKSKSDDMMKKGMMAQKMMDKK